MATRTLKTASEKRASLPKRVDRTAEFKKSWDRYNKAGRHDMHELREVMRLLWVGETPPKEYLDHELTGEWSGCRECHIRGDFLLIYRTTRDEVIFVDLGSHAELFR